MRCSFMALVVLLLPQMGVCQYLVNHNFAHTFGDLDPVNPYSKTTIRGEFIYTVCQTTETGEGYNIYLKKYGFDGTESWTYAINGSASGNDYAMDVVVDENDNVFVTGAVENTGTGYDIVVTKLNSTGTHLWTYNYNYQGTTNEMPSSMCLGDAGKVYVTGRTQPSDGDADVVTFEVDATGNPGWAVVYDQDGADDGGVKIMFDAGEVDVLAATTASSQLELSKITYQAIDGTSIANKRTNLALNGVNLNDLKQDGNGNYVACGQYNSNGQLNAVVASFDDTLGLNWLDSVDGFGFNDYANSLDIDDSNKVYVVGRVDTSLGRTTLLHLKYKSDGTVIDESILDSSFYRNSFGAKVLCGEKSVYLSIIAESVRKEPFMHTLRVKSDTVFMERIHGVNGKMEYPEHLELLGDDSLLIVHTNLTDSTATLSSRFETYYFRDTILELDSVNGDYLGNQQIWRFNADVLDTATINDTTIYFAPLGDFFVGDFLDTLGLYFDTFVDFSKVYAKKIFSESNSRDTISITLSGDTISKPPFWTTLTLLYNQEVDEDTLAAIADSLLPKRIVYVEKVLPVFLHYMPDDCDRNKQKTYVGGSSFENDIHINMEKAWDLEKGKASTWVGVFDSGIDWLHPDFCETKKCWLKPDNRVKESYHIDEDSGERKSSIETTTSLGATQDQAPITDDGIKSWAMNGHGTPVSGIIGAMANNDKHMAGIAGGDIANGQKGASIVSYRIYGTKQAKASNRFKDWCSWTATNEHIAKAMKMSFTNTEGPMKPVNLTNHSWGFGWNVTSQKDLQTVKEAFEFLAQNGVLNVCSSGNMGKNNKNKTKQKHWNALGEPNYPSSFFDHGILKVGGFEKHDDELIRIYYSYHHNHLDLVAPTYVAAQGVGVYTLQDRAPEKPKALNPPGPTNYFSGTSASAPQATGVAALLISYHERDPLGTDKLYPDDLEWILQQSSADIAYTNHSVTVGNHTYSETASSGYDGYTGFGRLNAYKALQMIKRPKFRIEHYKVNAAPKDHYTTVVENENIRVMEYSGGLKKDTKYKGDVYKMSILVTGDYPLPDNGDTYEPATPTNSPFLSSNGWWTHSSKTQLWGYDPVKKELYPNTGLDFIQGGNGWYITYDNGVKKMNATLEGYFFRCEKTAKWYPFNPKDKIDIGFSMYFTKEWGLDIDSDQLGAYSIYPNPSQSQLTVEGSMNRIIQKLRIFDTHGRLVKILENDGLKKININIEHLAEGLYALEITDEFGVTMQKFVKE